MVRRMPLGLGGLWLRLALAFLVVSVVAVVMDTALTAAGLSRDVTAVARQQQVLLAHAVADSSGAAYQGVGWQRANLHPVFDLAERAGAAVEVRSQAGRLVGESPGYPTYPTAGELTLPIMAAANAANRILGRVGQIIVRFNHRNLGALATRFEAHRMHARILAAAIAALIALAASVIGARLSIVPIEVVLRALRARASGDRSYRISRLRAPGVLHKLLEEFNETSDALDARDRAQRNLVADIAHEVRTPVAVLQGEAEALMDGISEPTPQNLASLHTEVLRLARMLDDLQRLAAAEAAEIQLQRHRYDLAEIAAEVADRLRDLFASKEVTLSTDLEPAVALCDKDRIQDVVSNLLTNALKFTPAGGHVTIQTGRNGDHQAIVRVSDTGIGIPADELPHVTERFFRGRRSAGLVSGSGIGMAIVAELLRANQGQLAISSEEGQGTQIAISLPEAANE